MLVSFRAAVSVNIHFVVHQNKVCINYEIASKDSTVMNRIKGDKAQRQTAVN